LVTNGAIGLIAGSGKFPLQFAHGAARNGLKVICIGVAGEAPDELIPLVHRFYRVPVWRVGRMIRCFKRHSVQHAVMAGKITKQVMHTPWRVWKLLPDWRTIHLWWFEARHDKSDDSLLLAVIKEFGRDRIQFESALKYCPELLVKAGCLTRRRPSSAEQRDIDYAWVLAKEMGRLDVGQSVCVKERSVLAVEAIEGTDRAIQRAGRHCPRGGFTVVKVAKPQQDDRFDVPTIGTDTIETMHAAGATCLALEAENTIVLEQEAVARLADQHGIAIVAR